MKLCSVCVYEPTISIQRMFNMPIARRSRRHLYGCVGAKSAESAYDRAFGPSAAVVK